LHTQKAVECGLTCGQHSSSAAVAYAIFINHQCPQVSAEMGLPYREGLVVVKNRYCYVGRTFIMTAPPHHIYTPGRLLNATETFANIISLLLCMHYYFAGVRRKWVCRTVKAS
jgi:hypothetical protein